MNSETWLVEHQGSTYVAKAVSPTAVEDLIASGEVATALAEAGFVTGRPIPTRDGPIGLGEPALALLEHVPGRELDGESDEEQGWIASTLAGVHAASNPAPGPSNTATFAQDWLSPQMPGVEAHPWLTVAIASVRDETDPLATPETPDSAAESAHGNGRVLRLLDSRNAVLVNVCRTDGRNLKFGPARVAEPMQGRIGLPTLEDVYPISFDRVWRLDEVQTTRSGARLRRDARNRLQIPVPVVWVDVQDPCDDDQRSSRGCRRAVGGLSPRRLTTRLP